MLCILTVFNVCANEAHAQSYLFTLENVLTQHPRNYNLTDVHNGTLEGELFAEAVDNNNTRIFLYKNTAVDSNNELSQTAMDVITIIWYVATFLALAAFFMLMACSDRRCRNLRSRQANATPADTQRAPPTPSPSYSEFAPPSYDTVIKMQHAAKTSVFVIPFNGDGSKNTDSATPTTPAAPSPCTVYSIDEQKANK
ncbi:CG15673 [Drosophila busckii]|uniref:CG15673 n=2 Tax=Drosophila busckii TaxID=30019 RepID=A0A0M4EBN9_DROBS|nr:CG15673 [Drosophila busckii]